MLTGFLTRAVPSSAGQRSEILWAFMMWFNCSKESASLWSYPWCWHQPGYWVSLTNKENCRLYSYEVSEWRHVKVTIIHDTKVTIRIFFPVCICVYICVWEWSHLYVVLPQWRHHHPYVTHCTMRSVCFFFNILWEHLHSNISAALRLQSAVVLNCV